MVKVLNKQKKFRLQSKLLFLTYSPCGLDLPEILKQLKEKLILTRINSYALVKEKSTSNVKGEDFHVHVFIRTERRNNIVSSTRLDLIENGKNLHGNYQAVKSISSTLEYMLKDLILKNLQDLKDEYILFSDDLQLQITDSFDLLTFSETMIDLGRKGLYKEALALLEKEKPDVFFKEHKVYTRLLVEHNAMANGAVYNFKLKDFTFPPSLINVINSAEKQNKSLMLTGRSGSGKTQLILAYLRESRELKPLIINNINSIKDFNTVYHDCILFDDVNWTNVPREEMIKYMDSFDECTFRVTYGDVRIPAKTPRFIISNKPLQAYLSYDLSLPENKAITRRLLAYELGNEETLYVPIDEEQIATELKNILSEPIFYA